MGKCFIPLPSCIEEIKGAEEDKYPFELVEEEMPKENPYSNSAEIAKEFKKLEKRMDALEAWLQGFIPEYKLHQHK